MLLLPQQVSEAENTSVVVHPENTSIYNVFVYFLLRDQDNAIIRPLPKIKRMISDNACLPHIVQVFAPSKSVGGFFAYIFMSYPVC